MSKAKDFTGMRFGRLVVVKRVPDYVSPKGSHITRWLCQCDCGNTKEVNSTDLNNGKTLSCGCLLKEHTTEMGYANKQFNRYDLTGEYGIGYTNKGEPFYFDLEDYDKIKKYCWGINSQGYVRANDLTKKNRYILMHQLLSNFGEMLPDHHNRNKADNRKFNLVPSTFAENVRNKDILPSNKSGFTGVCKKDDKWRAYITYNKRQIDLGLHSELREAVVARLKAEKKYFGEFAPQRHLFKEYGIE